MARVSTYYRVRQVGQTGAGTPVKRVPRLGPVLARAMVDATAVQLRILAEEARELLIDRLMAGRPQGYFYMRGGRRRMVAGQAVVQRPSVLRAQGMLAVSRAPFLHRPLARRTVMAKIRAGEDTRKLLATGDYIAGIEVFRGFQQESGVYYMVRPALREHEPSGLTLTIVARIHEYGSASMRIPARPHWGPTTRDVIRRRNQMAQGVLAGALRAALRQIA